jgi:hypothetical protein
MTGGSQLLEKIPEGSLSLKAKTSSPQKKDQADTGPAKKDMFANLTEDEKNFTLDYRKLEDLEREKGIKFFECVGDPPMTEAFAENTNETRHDFVTKRENGMRDKDTHRFSTEVNQDKVLVPAPNEITSAPKWDEHQNNHFTMKRRLN